MSRFQRIDLGQTILEGGQALNLGLLSQRLSGCRITKIVRDSLGRLEGQTSSPPADSRDPSPLIGRQAGGARATPTLS
jgi:hypothetical protein